MRKSSVKAIWRNDPLGLSFKVIITFLISYFFTRGVITTFWGCF